MSSMRIIKTTKGVERQVTMTAPSEKKASELSVERKVTITKKRPLTVEDDKSEKKITVIKKPKTEPLNTPAAVNTSTATATAKKLVVTQKKMSPSIPAPHFNDWSPEPPRMNRGSSKKHAGWLYTAFHNGKRLAPVLQDIYQTPFYDSVVSRRSPHDHLGQELSELFVQACKYQYKDNIVDLFNQGADIFSVGNFYDETHLRFNTDNNYAVHLSAFHGKLKSLEALLPILKTQRNPFMYDVNNRYTVLASAIVGLQPAAVDLIVKQIPVLARYPSIPFRASRKISLSQHLTTILPHIVTAMRQNEHCEKEIETELRKEFEMWQPKIPMVIDQFKQLVKLAHMQNNRERELLRKKLLAEPGVLSGNIRVIVQALNLVEMSHSFGHIEMTPLELIAMMKSYLPAADHPKLKQMKKTIKAAIARNPEVPAEKFETKVDCMRVFPSSTEGQNNTASATSISTASLKLNR